MDFDLTSAAPNQTFEESRHELRLRGLKSAYFFNKAALGMKDLTPEVHGKVCDFMSDRNVQRKMLRMFRGGLKTSVAQIGDILWDATNFLLGYHPLSDKEFEYPILVAMSTATNAWLKSGELDEQYQHKSPVYRWLYPEIEIGNVWKKEERHLVVRDEAGKITRQVAIEYVGVGGATASRHFRKIKLDDLHAVEKAEESAASVEDVVRWYTHTDSLLIEPSTDYIDLIGTCASLLPQDVYLYVLEHEKRYVGLDIPCYDDSGEPTWSERFPRWVLENIRRKQGDVLFAKNYMLKYLDPTITEFTTKDLIRYRVLTGSRPVYMLENGKKYFDYELFPSMTVDLAGWRGKGDKNAVLTMGTSADDMHLILDSWKKRCPPDELIDVIIDRHKRFHVPVVGVEEVAYQECLSYFLEKRIREERLYLRVVPLKPGRVDKDARIRTMQPYQRSRQIAVGEGDTLFLDEFAAFPRGEKHLLDCYAYQPLTWSNPSGNRTDHDEREELQDYLRSVGAMEATA